MFENIFNKYIFQFLLKKEDIFNIYFTHNSVHKKNYVKILYSILNYLLYLHIMFSFYNTIYDYLRETIRLFLLSFDLDDFSPLRRLLSGFLGS